MAALASVITGQLQYQEQVQISMELTKLALQGPSLSQAPSRPDNALQWPNTFVKISKLRSTLTLLLAEGTSLYNFTLYTLGPTKSGSTPVPKLEKRIVLLWVHFLRTKQSFLEASPSSTSDFPWHLIGQNCIARRALFVTWWVGSGSLKSRCQG